MILGSTFFVLEKVLSSALTLIYGALLYSIVALNGMVLLSGLLYMTMEGIDITAMALPAFGKSLKIDRVKLMHLVTACFAILGMVNDLIFSILNY